MTVSPLDETLWVDADATRIEQIVANLFRKGTKYTNDGGTHLLESIGRSPH